MSTDAEMHRLYANVGLSLMRIAKMHDCRLREVKAALVRHKHKTLMRAAQRAAQADRARKITLDLVSILERTECSD